MTHPLTKLERIAAGLIAILAFGALALQTTINDDRDGSALVAFALLFRYFTIWSNFAAGIIMALVATGRRIPGWVLFALATALSQVGIVYHALLAADHHPVGADWWTNIAFHTLIPLAVVSWWFVYSRGDGVGWRSIPTTMIAPVIYTGFALIYGELSGFYPYFFLDLPQFGWVRIVLNIAGLSLFFMLIGSALLGVRALVKKAISADA